LRQDVHPAVEAEPLTSGGRIVAWGILAITAALVLVSMLGVKLGLSTFIAGAATAVVVLIGKCEPPRATLKRVSWGVLPLLSGLFAMVEAVEQTGAA
jgi:arsenical pump membrane protein